MKTVKLGKMEPDYMCSPMESKSEDRPMVERFPTVYINLESLPDLRPGQEITLKGVVTSFSDKKVRTKEDGKQEVETVRNCEVDIMEMTPGEAKGVQDPPALSDEDEIDKGLDEAEAIEEDEDEE